MEVIEHNCLLTFFMIIFLSGAQVVYILDQVRALENEMFLRIQKQGLDVTPRILIVSVFMPCNPQLINWVHTECTF